MRLQAREALALAIVAACAAPPPPPPIAPTPPPPIDAAAADATLAPPPDPVMAEVLVELTAQRDRMCACADAACVEAAEAAQVEWGAAHQDLLGRARATPDQARAATALIAATETCAHALAP